MSAQLIDGNAIAEQMKEEIAQEIEDLKGRGISPHLVAVQVGENPASRVYVNNQRKNCEKVGIKYTLLELPGDTSQDALKAKIAELSSSFL